jgi:hypothetical protein
LFVGLTGVRFLLEFVCQEQAQQPDQRRFGALVLIPGQSLDCELDALAGRQQAEGEQDLAPPVPVDEAWALLRESVEADLQGAALRASRSTAIPRSPVEAVFGVCQRSLRIVYRVIKPGPAAACLSCHNL